VWSSGSPRDPASAAENFGKAPGTARLIFTPLTPHISHTISCVAAPKAALQSLWPSTSFRVCTNASERVRSVRTAALKTCAWSLAHGASGGPGASPRACADELLFTCQPDTLSRHVSHLSPRFFSCSADKRRLPAQMRFTPRCTTTSCFTSTTQILTSHVDVDFLMTSNP
jgi:hypothetical protein